MKWETNPRQDSPPELEPGESMPGPHHWYSEPEGPGLWWVQYDREEHPRRAEVRCAVDGELEARIEGTPRQDRWTYLKMLTGRGGWTRWKLRGFARTPPVLQEAGGPQMEDYLDWDSWYTARTKWVSENMSQRPKQQARDAAELAALSREVQNHFAQQQTPKKENKP